MSGKLFLFSFILLTTFCLKAVSQDIVFTLPIVGDTISYEEKVKYLLFEEIPANDYLFSVVSRKNKDTIITHYKKSGPIELKTTRNYINSFLTNISKLNSYYAYLENNETNKAENNSLYKNQNSKKESVTENDKMDKILKTDPSVKVNKKDKKQEDKNSFNTPEEKRRLQSVYYGGFEERSPTVRILK